MDRKEYIGSSDISAVMGLNRWQSPLGLWAEKTGSVEPKDLSEYEAVELGIELEDFVAKKFQKKTGLRVRRAPKRYIHKEYSYLRCQVDRLIENTDDLLEVKTCSAWKAKEWIDEEIPQEYILQVIYQLGITGRKTGYIAVLIGGQAFKYKKIDFDRELFDKQVEAAKAFWQMVQDKTPPMACGMDNDLLVELYPDDNQKIQEIEEVNHKIAYLQELKAHIKELQGQKEGIEAEIKAVIADNLGIKTSEYIVKWIPQVRASVDTKKLKEDNLYDKYSRQTSLRVLQVRKEKKEYGNTANS
jgi:putative phage-type endonuclease